MMYSQHICIYYLLLKLSTYFGFDEGLLDSMRLVDIFFCLGSLSVFLNSFESAIYV